MTPVSLVPALFVWQTPDAGQFAWLIALGIVATLGHQSMARSLGATDATAVYPLDFTRLIFAKTLHPYVRASSAHSHFDRSVGPSPLRRFFANVEVEDFT